MQTIPGRKSGRDAARDMSICSVAPEAEQSADKEAAKSDDYSTEMQQKMGTTMTYRHELGMNYNRIIEDVIVGSCLQVPDDVDKLVDDENVSTIVCLQRDSDMAYFDLDIAPIQKRCEEVDGVWHVRLGINDFDPYNLRLRLPAVIKEMAQIHRENEGTVYIHCTAGMGRAPAVALAYMWWVKGIHLEDAYATLYAARKCHPKLYAIRQAAADILYGGDQMPVTIRKRGTSLSKVVEIAGLDIGWGNKVAMTKVGADTWELKRTLPPGVFPYKFVMDGFWSYDADLPTLFDGENTNNIVDVVPNGLSDAQLVARKRVLREGGRLTKEEAQRLRAFVLGNSP